MHNTIIAQLLMLPPSTVARILKAVRKVHLMSRGHVAVDNLLEALLAREVELRENRFQQREDRRRRDWAS